MALCLLVLILENYGLLWNVMIAMKMFQEYRRQENKNDNYTRKHTEIKDLFIWQGLKYYTTYFIDYSTSNETIERLIQEAQKTKIFTIVSHYNLESNTKSMYIEFVQIRHSYIISIHLTLTNSFY